MKAQDAKQHAENITDDNPKLGDLFERAEDRGLPVTYEDRDYERRGYAEDDSVMILDCEDGDVIVQPEHADHQKGGWKIDIV